MEDCCIAHSCFVIDNRIVPYNDFRTEAASASFHNFLCDLIAKLVFLSHSYDWLNDPLGFAIAASPSNSKVVAIKAAHLAQLKQAILDSKFSILGGNNAANGTWDEYLTDGLAKILNILPQQFFVSNGKERLLIVIYSTDLSLFGGTHSGSIENGLNSFKTLIEHINQVFPKNVVKIRIVAAMVHNPDISISLNDNQGIFYREIISQYGSLIEFEKLQVASISFEEELKLIVSELTPKRLISLELPGTYMKMKCNVTLQLVPHSISSVSCIPYIQTLEICSITTRSGINPLYIQGTPLTVIAPTDEYALRKLGGDPLK